MPAELGRLLVGQKALVTGASSGIGEAIARRLASGGAAVGINYRSGAEAARNIVAAIQASGEDAIALQADVSSEPDVQSMFRAFCDAFGRVDILVANSGIQMDAPAPEMSLEQWRRVLDVNLMGVVHGIRAFVPAMIARGRPARPSSSASPPPGPRRPGSPTYLRRRRAASSARSSGRSPPPTRAGSAR